MFKRNDKGLDGTQNIGWFYSGDLNTGTIWIPDKLKSGIQMAQYADALFMAKKWSLLSGYQMAISLPVSF